MRLSLFKRISSIFNYANCAKSCKASYILFSQGKCYTILPVDIMSLEFK